MKNKISDGGHFRFTGAAKVAGDGVVQGSRFGVLQETVASTETGVAVTHGVFELAKLSTDVVTAGAKLYWDNTNFRLTLTASTHVFAGWAYEAAGNGVALCKVELAGGDHDT